MDSPPAFGVVASAVLMPSPDTLASGPIVTDSHLMDMGLVASALELVFTLLVLFINPDLPRVSASQNILVMDLA